jgi:hypothetical protein
MIPYFPAGFSRDLPVLREWGGRLSAVPDGEVLQLRLPEFSTPVARGGWLVETFPAPPRCGSKE